MQSSLTLRIAAALVVCLAWAVAARADDAAEKVKFYEQHVKPVLEGHCWKCHGAEVKVKGGLNLTSRALALKGGDIGPAIDEKEPGKSLLLRAISYTDEDLQMPPKGKLSAEHIATLTKWVEMGAPYPAVAEKPLDQGAEAKGHRGPPAADSKEARAHWSFQAVNRPEVPDVRNKAWVRNPIDAFILAKLEEKGMTPAGEASRGALLRRAYYDLIGLPPTPEEVEAFIKDTSPDAYEKVIDRLLESPHYGEKWGRHWLDLVRYAETNSYERDNPKPNAWRYRDYVIRSFNQDKPYDVFLKEQLAGDEMPDAQSNPDRMIATGFYRLGIWDDEPTDPLLAKYDGLDDIVTVVGQVMLGVTIDCARCHDHKIDPVPQKDYYKLIAFFQNINHFKNGGPTDETPIFAERATREAYAQRAAEREQRKKMAQDAVTEMHRDFIQLLSGEAEYAGATIAQADSLIRQHGKRVFGEERYARYQQLRRQLREMERPDRNVELALCVTEAGPTPPETYVWVRGNAGVKGAKVEPGFLEVLGTPAAVVATPLEKSTGRRTVLANWIASKENPLTARVMVNRIWQYHFGRGIVRTSTDLGFQGERPTHPELLDWLAAEFTSRGWRMKEMHRLMMTSSAYRMSSNGDRTALAADPQNNLMWRFDLRRLTAEEIRDSILQVNGTLNLTMHGPSVYPPIPKEVMAGQSVPGKGWETSGGADARRRSVYVHVKRSLRLPVIEAFDGPETDKPCPVRFVTVQPTQALGMLNSEFMNEEAQRLADRLRREVGDDPRRQVERALRLVTGRTPGEKEVARGMELIERLASEDGATPDRALRYFCLVALNLNEFVYVD